MITLRDAPKSTIKLDRRTIELGDHTHTTNSFILGDGQSPHTLTIAGGHTLRGGGQIGDNTIKIVNGGTLIADASLGTTLTTSGFDNTSGLIQVTDGSALTLGSSTTVINGGTIQGFGAGRLSGGSGTFQNLLLEGGLYINGGTLDGVTINDSLTVGNGGRVSAKGKITTNGTFAINGGNNGAAYLFLSGDTTWRAPGRPFWPTPPTASFSAMVRALIS